MKEKLAFFCAHYKILDLSLQRQGLNQRFQAPLLSEFPLLHSAILKTKATANELSNTCLTLPILKDFSHYAKGCILAEELNDTV